MIEIINFEINCVYQIDIDNKQVSKIIDVNQPIYSTFHVQKSTKFYFFKYLSKNFLKILYFRNFMNYSWMLLKELGSQLRVLENSYEFFSNTPSCDNQPSE